MTHQEEIDRQASDWVVQLDSGDVTAARREQFKAWLKADPRHALAYEQARAAWHDLGAMHEWRDRVPIPEPPPAGRTRLAPRPHLIAIAAAAVLGVVGLATLSSFRRAHTEELATPTAQIREIDLSDGSRVTLGARSAIDVRYAARERRVILRQGEAFFAVAREASRPFVVVADDTLIRVLGTQFNVHRESQRVRVAVKEGAVEVVRARGGDVSGAPPARYRLAAGERIVTGQGAAPDSLDAVASDAVGAWRSGRLVYENATLGEVIGDARRYSETRIELGDPALERLRVTASFQASEIEHLPDTLALAFPVRVERDARGRVRLEPAP